MRQPGSRSAQHRMTPSWLLQKVSATALLSCGSPSSTAISPLHRWGPMLSASKSAPRRAGSTSLHWRGRMSTSMGLCLLRLCDSQRRKSQIRLASPNRHSRKMARTSSPLIMGISLPFRLCPTAGKALCFVEIHRPSRVHCGWFCFSNERGAYFYSMRRREKGEVSRETFIFRVGIFQTVCYNELKSEKTSFICKE